MKKTTEKFIQEAISIHGVFYDYSLVNYEHSNKKVKIICPIHGEFEQRANGHLRGYKCRQCSNDKQKLTKEEFIIKCKKVHGEKYDYSLINYKTYDDKIKIICPIHGEFEQFPHNHLKGCECLECSFINRKTSDDKFIRKAEVKHNNKYDYSKINYNGFNNKIKILCPIHGEFEQTPHSHLKGQGCPVCCESKGEVKIRELLNSKNIKFIPQYKFKECRYKYPLPFDFYLPDYNTCIEFNGIQHYKVIPHWGGVDRFLEQQTKDKIKNDFCFHNKINLIVIKYNENINKIITKLKKNTKWVK
jgi:hypothetical protein